MSPLLILVNMSVNNFLIGDLAVHATRKLWTWLAVICVLSFAVLGWVGTEIYLTAPPIPKQVISTQGEVLFAEGQVQLGQEA